MKNVKCQATICSVCMGLQNVSLGASDRCHRQIDFSCREGRSILSLACTPSLPPLASSAGYLPCGELGPRSGGLLPVTGAPSEPWKVFWGPAPCCECRWWGIWAEMRGTWGRSRQRALSVCTFQLYRTACPRLGNSGQILALRGARWDILQLGTLLRRGRPFTERLLSRALFLVEPVYAHDNLSGSHALPRFPDAKPYA